MMEENNFNNWFANWYEDDELTDINPKYDRDLVVYSRDWTIETIVNQIEIGNIELNPKFQRRNAWNDIRRSRLIESLILNLPVPEIVLAEDQTKKKSFLMIDGKQRLLTIAGFMKPVDFQYWDKPCLKNMTVLKGLNGVTYDELKTIPEYEKYIRQFINSDIRCTVISNYNKNDILYDIFYRLNTGSVPLSTQELRQVLNKGDYADYLIQITNSLQPVHKILGLEGPDSRLRDVEIILRLFSFILFGKNYKSNLKNFLDDSMNAINSNWKKFRKEIDRLYCRFNESIDKLGKVFEIEEIGRRYSNNKLEKRFNKVLFEVEAYYFMLIDFKSITKRNNERFVDNFKKLCDNKNFLDSIQFSTKSLDNYRNRFTLFQNIINKSYNLSINNIPIKK